MILMRTPDCEINLICVSRAKLNQQSGTYVLSSSQQYKLLTFQKQLWQDYDESAEKAAEVAPEVEAGPMKSKYIDIIISDVRTTNFGFSVQILNTEGAIRLEFIRRICPYQTKCFRHRFSGKIDARLFATSPRRSNRPCWLHTKERRLGICQVL